MKILMVSSYLPYPLFSGGHIRLYNLLKHLGQKNEITLVCEKRDYQTGKDIEMVEKVCKKVITVRRDKQWSFKNILHTAFSSSPFLVVGHTSPIMKKEIRRILDEEKPDLIHVETSYVMQNLPKTKVPVVLVDHNIEYMVYRRFVENALPILRPLLNLDIKKLKSREESYWQKADKLVAVSDHDKKIMGRDDAIVIPNGVDIDKFRVKRFDFRRRQKKILFIGDFKWIQNRDSATWIIKNVWPHIDARAKENGLDLALWIVGKRIPKYIKELEEEKIIIDENAPVETERIFEKSDVLLSPIRVGGGTKFKILEAMASGVPVITNEMGNEGINAKDNEEILIRFQASEIADAIMELLYDNEKYEKIARNARIYIEKNFDWRNISAKLQEVYERTVS